MTTAETLKQELKTEYFQEDEGEDCCGGYLRPIGDIPEVRDAILRVVEAALEEINTKLIKDHSKCPIKMSCIGYENAKCDLENETEAILLSLRGDKEGDGK